MTTTINKTPEFLKKWEERDFRRMRLAIRTHFGRRGAHTKDGYKIFNNYEQLDQCFGLAYTSSSDYAGYWICNTEVYLDYAHIYHYVGFALGVNDVPYAILWDKDENEIIIEL